MGIEKDRKPQNYRNKPENGQHQDISLCPLLLYLPSQIHVCLCVGVCWTDKNWNFSAVRSPTELKLGGNLGLVSQISVHVLVSKFDSFLYCKQTKERNNRQNCENHGFTKLVFSPPFQV
jgi:hypothetical protein